MIPRRRKSDDYIGPATGAMKWINKIIRFLLFPFIHPLCFVIVLAVLGGAVVGIHYFADVAYKDIPSWIANKGNIVYEDVSQKVDTGFISNISDKITKMTDKASGLWKKNDVVENNVSQEEVKPVRETVRAIDRKAFRRSQDNPIDVKATLENGQAKAMNTDKDPLFAYKRNNSLGLTYRKEPRIVKGSVEVVNVNEIKINGEQMFLYGIYSQPTSTRGIDGAVYLKSLVMDKEVECHVVAFTQNAELTAVCAVDGFSINHKMVDMGFSQNVSLR